MSALSTARGELAAVHDLTVAYGHGPARVEALRDVTLTIAPSESVALWGRSGSGKTTLLHALGGLVEPSHGDVRWLGEPLSSLDAAARGRTRASGIAYVFQGANLLPNFTAFENVAFAAYHAGTAEVDPAELLTLVGLQAKLDFLPAELSGGEAQRVAIARALAQRAELLLCDEPTGHLDGDTGARVLDLIERLHETYRFALVLATHNADVAARCTRLIELHDGRVVGDGAPA
ncbi:MAG TPA: ABC transporter ATP-binding protein [Conexibacter sp.]|nr:ABC transporter ATP-binding protein [Conexibacter sp.]